MDTINFLQWNIRSIKANKVFLETTLFSNKIGCALIAETWLKPTEDFNLSGYNIIRANRLDGYGGSCIIIKKGIPYTVLNCFNDNDAMQICAIKIFLKNKALTVVSLYIKPNHRMNSNKWTKTFQQFSSPLIIGGDFNAHHNAWSCEIPTDFEGEQLADAFTNSSYTLLNDGSETLINKPGCRKSAVDLTLCSPFLAPHINWSIIHASLGSNHYPILINLGSSKNHQYTIFPNSKWDIKNADWLHYYNITNILATNILQQGFNDLSTQDKYTTFIELINMSAEISIPKKGIKKVNSFKSRPWWDNDCKNRYKEMK